MPRDPQNGALADIVPVILAGGAGRRLWPLSTTMRPKPFLKGPGGQSFLQKTVERTTGLQPPFIVCQARHRALVTQQVRESAQIILEPEGRGTAPALAVAAHFLARQGDPLVLVMPSDHQIRRPEAFREAVSMGVSAARQGWLVMFGGKPSRPSSHYGLIIAVDSFA